MVPARACPSAGAKPVFPKNRRRRDEIFARIYPERLNNFPWEAPVHSCARAQHATEFRNDSEP